MTTQPTINRSRAFSLVEVLLVLAIISIMAALVINAFSNAAQDSRNVMARQQQATLQSALNNWVASQIGGHEYPDTTNPTKRYDRTVAYMRKKYNFGDKWWENDPAAAGGAARTTQGRADMIKSYLDEDTFQHFVDHSEANVGAGDDYPLKSAAMKKTGQYLELPAWADPSAASANPYPKVDLYP